jgi:hypothetical protein
MQLCLILSCDVYSIGHHTTVKILSLVTTRFFDYMYYMIMDYMIMDFMIIMC